MIRIYRFIQARRRAKRDYRYLCRENRGPMLYVDIHIHPDDPEWSELKGVTGIRTTIPLDGNGIEFINNSVGAIRETCIRRLIDDQDDTR